MACCSLSVRCGTREERVTGAKGGGGRLRNNAEQLRNGTECRSNAEQLRNGTECRNNTEQYCNTAEHFGNGAECFNNGPEQLRNGAECRSNAEQSPNGAERFRSGTAHFVEHTLFKGTLRKSAAVINGYLEKLGGELNAYTTKEEIVLHATVLKEDIGKAAELLFELATQSAFPEKEVEKEKTVILDEIASYKDSPADDIYDRFESLLFEGHPLCGNVLGTPASVRRISAEELKEFVRTFFIPERTAFTIVSPLPEEDSAELVRKLSKKYFGGSDRRGGQQSGEAGLESPQTGGQGSPMTGSPELEGIKSGDQNLESGKPVELESEGIWPGKPEPEGGKPVEPESEGIKTEGRQEAMRRFAGNIFTKTVNRHSHQANCIIGATAPSLGEEKERIAAALMANILGGPAANSILNAKLREKRGLVYNVECSYTQYADSGVMAICFGCDREHLEECITVIRKEIDRLQTVPLSDSRLKAAKKQLEGQMAIASENSESQALSMGKSLLAFGCVQGDGYVRKAISAVTAEDIQKAAGDIFNSERLSTLIYL